ncbi:hypothetical protein Tco_0985488 [Tanacetum coccineum]
MSKVLQERGFGSLPSSTETNPRGHVNSISTTKADSNEIRHIGSQARKVKILETYNHTLPQKENDPRSFTLPYFIHSVCFDKSFVDRGASVSVMPFSTYTNLGLKDLAHTRLTVELDDRTIKHPRGFSIIEDIDVTSGVVLGMPFYKKFVSCQKIMEKFARRDECERLKEE